MTIIIILFSIFSIQILSRKIFNSFIFNTQNIVLNIKNFVLVEKNERQCNVVQISPPRSFFIPVVCRLSRLLRLQVSAHRVGPCQSRVHLFFRDVTIMVPKKQNESRKKKVKQKERILLYLSQVENKKLMKTSLLDDRERQEFAATLRAKGVASLRSTTRGGRREREYLEGATQSQE